MAKTVTTKNLKEKKSVPMSADIIRLPSLTWNEIPPEIQDFYRLYKAGQLNPKGKIKWEGMNKFSDVWPFLESGCDLSVLGDLLKQEPSLITHPFVWVTLTDLHDKLSSRQEKSYKAILEASLKMILQPFTKGLLPTFDIKWAPINENRKVGRPKLEKRHKVTNDDRRTYIAYKTTLAINQEELPTKKLKRAKEQQTINNYLADGIRRIWTRWDPRILETRMLDDGELGYERQPQPLPDEKVDEWVADVLGIQEEKLQFRDQLAYRMVAFHLNTDERKNLTHHAIKKRVEKVRDNDPTFVQDFKNKLPSLLSTSRES